jgi:hypothetical protein
MKDRKQVTLLLKNEKVIKTMGVEREVKKMLKKMAQLTISFV